MGEAIQKSCAPQVVMLVHFLISFENS